ncbi:MAG TPA: FhaA domain-containing protein [Anaerolineales bacterium]
MNLRLLESRLRELLEVRLIRAIPGRRPEDFVVRQLTQAMQMHVRTEPGGARIAPNVFTLLVPASALPRWQNPGLGDTLVQIIKTAAADSGLSFHRPPTLTFSQDATVGPDGIKVIASHSAESIGQTQDMPADTDSSRPAAEEAPSVPENAFLIVDGVKEFPLTRPVINLGRRLDNDLVIDDPRVSRHHAQLRAIKNRYVLFDLNSSGGTFINGQRTSQTVLYPGDVISLAGVSLIFGQDIPLPQRDLGQTGPRSKVGAERPTAIITRDNPVFRKNQ